LLVSNWAAAPAAFAPGLLQHYAMGISPMDADSALWIHLLETEAARTELLAHLNRTVDEPAVAVAGRASRASSERRVALRPFAPTEVSLFGSPLLILVFSTPAFKCCFFFFVFSSLFSALH
jgi:hypothetical protein